MALQRDAKYPGRFDAATTEQPQGAFKNRTSTTAKDGSYLEKDWLNDFSGFFSSLLDVDGVSADGNVDEVGASQYYDSLKSIVDGESSLSASGYQILPSGLVMQWGESTTSGGNGSFTATYPISFPNLAFGAFANAQQDNNNATFFAGGLSSANGSAIKTDPSSGNVNSIDGLTVNWLAIGY